jgi:heme A synthase
MQRKFSWFAWLVLAYNIPVILWGAYVRVSFSGDGCGSNWPFCNGQAIPKAMKLPTMIEYLHRMSSTLDTVLVLALLVWALLAFPKRHAVRLYAAASLLFLLIEALLGAGLVLFRYVANDLSAGRPIYLSAHLTNTLLLLAVLTTTAWAASRGVPEVRLRAVPGLIWVALGIAIVVAVTGVIAALGDMLFPVASLSAGIRQDFAASQLLLHLRLLHPIIAVAGSAFILYVAGRYRSKLVAGIVIGQICAGFVNLSLLAPVWMQIVHLFIADLLWISLVVLALRCQMAENLKAWPTWSTAETARL